MILDKIIKITISCSHDRKGKVHDQNIVWENPVYLWLLDNFLV